MREFLTQFAIKSEFPKCATNVHFFVVQKKKNSKEKENEAHHCFTFI